MSNQSPTSGTGQQGQQQAIVVDVNVVLPTQFSQPTVQSSTEARPVECWCHCNASSGSGCCP
jgi:hypothetical protein